MNNGTDNQKILGNCPSCQRLMQIPVVTNVASVAKCPHCNNEIRVRDLLASAVPEAEIIDKDQDKDRVSDYIADRKRVYDDESPKARTKFEVPNQIYNGASRRNRKRRSGSRGPSSRSRSSDDGARENGQSRVQGSNADSPTSRVSPSRNANNGTKSKSVASANGSATSVKPVSAASTKPVNVGSAAQDRRAPKPVARPSRSSSRGRRSDEMDDEVEFGVAEVLKFLIGGVIAAPLAYLALLWVLGVDPFGMASAFESISPSFIPEALRSDQLNNEPQSGFTPATSNSSAPLFGAGSDEQEFSNDFEDDSLPLPSLDPDLVR